ncbi:MAG: hypothetical protein M3441_00700 [Chloroflexota bacterium]|nr:hypothetical protein [Chloroflexota bacterium]
MSLIRHARRKSTVLLALLALAGGVLAGCAGPTAISEGGSTGKYDVKVRLDPVHLNPPALGTLSFEVTDQTTQKPVTQFEPVFDISDLMHTITIHKDATFFRHSFTDRLVLSSASVPVGFPEMGTYYTWTYFKPDGAELQVFKTKIQTGTEPVVQAQDEDLRPKVSYGLRVELLHGEEAWHVGEPVQLAFRVTQRGYPVRDLQAYFGAPGHLWILELPHEGDAAHAAEAEDVPELDHEMGSAPFYRAPQPTAAAGETPQVGEGEEGQSEQTDSGFPNSGNLVGSDNIGGGRAPTPPAPTFQPGVATAIATLTAEPVSTLLPVQQTAQSSVIGTPVVQPGVGYGPEVAFTHIFPRAGLYKVWLELLHGPEVIVTDFVVRIEE